MFKIIARILLLKHKKKLSPVPCQTQLKQYCNWTEDITFNYRASCNPNLSLDRSCLDTFEYCPICSQKIHRIDLKKGESL